MTPRNSGSDAAEDIRESRIPAELSGQRLDQALAQLFPEYSRSRLSQWIKDGRVLVDEAAARPRDAVMGGQKVQLRVPEEPLSDMAPEALPLEIVHEDAALIVVNKPVGLVVHPGAGNHSGTLQNALLHHAPELAQVPRAGLVHRIDKDTSGLLVVARTLEAHTALVAALQAREFERVYLAVALGVMTGGGTVDAPIKRHPTDRVRMSVREGGRESVTHYRVLKRYRAHTYISVELETGRTHQIRVHLAHIKYPLVGDQVYGRRLGPPRNASPKLQETLRAFHRQALHAAKLGLVHPVSGEALHWEVPPPPDFQQLLAALEEDLTHEG
ncbi:MAG TPA: 23S rRNA pseudouridine(1911/1915/1917) synthase RluD [Gammaproteobacteria bacterium]|jgi:23S rRNA pseudouridine1911/1915/1917 synthase